MKVYKTEFPGLLSTFALLSLLVFASGAHAQSGPNGSFAGPGHGVPGAELTIERIADRLELDDTQRQSIANIVEAAKPEFEALRESTRANRKTLAELDPADANYSNDLTHAAAENGRLATEATLLAARVRNEINAVLTDEQRARFERGRGRPRDAENRRADKR